jgi:RimJ/RimL family protein N-acetyltransferase
MDNRDVMLRGPRLVLVPYLAHHVARYHQWMQRPELLEATCSEPLTLEEEQENQVSWLNAADKLTFILLAPSAARPDAATGADAKQVPPLMMIGDCNIFVPHDVEDQGVEVEVMVAEDSCRGRGYAKEAVSLLMLFVMTTLPYRRFVAKILEDNAASRHLFERSLGFEVFKEVKVFHEVHSHRSFDTEAAKAALRAQCSAFEICTYDRLVDVDC